MRPGVLDDHRQRYEREGYVVLNALLTPAEVAALCVESDRVAEQVVDEALAVGGEHPRVHAERRDGRVVLVKVSPLNDASPIFGGVAADPRLTDFAAGLLGDEAVLLEEKLIYKLTLPGAPDILARASETFPFHTDWHYYRGDGYPKETLSIALAIDDATAANGCLQMVPRSHARAWDLEPDGPPNIAADAVTPDDVVDVVLHGGDAVAFISTLVHGSRENHTTGARRLLVLSYYPASCDIEFDKRNRGYREDARRYEERYREMVGRGAWQQRYRLSPSPSSGTRQVMPSA